MARRVFFSFHYDRDIMRVNVVRNSWLTHSDREAAGFFDASLWEDAKTNGDAKIKRSIDEALVNTSVTVVLVGAETAQRQYVQYEIKRSLERRNGLLAVRIHNIRNDKGQTDKAGKNPLPPLYPEYDWVRDNGYANFARWVEAAAAAAGK